MRHTVRRVLDHSDVMVQQVPYYPCEMPRELQLSGVVPDTTSRPWDTRKQPPLRSFDTLGRGSDEWIIRYIEPLLGKTSIHPAEQKHFIGIALWYISRRSTQDFQRSYHYHATARCSVHLD
jgi:hypothetical protein